ncbi:MAG: hypothetical protein KatS3mg076_1585 [Candidatus Binatia bacterium]|nr:MAG: hypothetical protein KatS3mg076_1585 [Candidatus Binatia bacterium]
MENRPAVLYDGRCAFCVAQARRLERWVGAGVDWYSFRDAGVLERYPRISAEECERAMQLVEPDGRVFSGAEAVARLLARRRLLRPLARVYYLPFLRPVFDRAYAWVARNRFRLGGRCEGEFCHLHDGERRPQRGPSGRRASAPTVE